MEMSVRARIRAGDPDTFGSLFDDYARAVYNHAFRLTGDWSTAEDVLSLTFLEAWRLRETVDPDGGSLRPWLLGIATNTARNTRRAARRHEAAVSRLPRAEALPDFAEGLVSRIDDAAQVAALRAALSLLRRPEREVVALCVWSGLDYATAAQALGIPVGTVRSRLSRARKKLHKYAGTGLPAENGNSHPGRGQAEGDRIPAVRRTQEETR
ncbi:RNA polymerase sigma factor [Streptomyces aidingensis]|uniref:RNA polymerase sigma-70 factor, ECF subfamily n=1 Tax=Streptomyces aidingensis TaxID=910347 RepID=A0A1I1H4Z4_9ACTN|nr:RNA polymerase sigma factor [Streptomyces aidingensis]SFC19024.1 RNA polymerase sigma-70 factor, ECF subfamily [Streptomyces aidingensis]